MPLAPSLEPMGIEGARLAVNEPRSGTRIPPAETGGRRHLSARFPAHLAP